MSLFDRLRGPSQTGQPARKERSGLLRRKARWEEAWRVYPGTVGGVAALWSVDLGAVGAAPLAHLSVRMDVEVEYAPDADGLPGDWAFIARAEDAVREGATRHGGVYVGRVAAGGVCRFTGHLAAEPAAKADLAALPQARTGFAYDPHWAYVRDSLAPDERQQQMLTDLAVVELLSEHGDLLATPRAVEHVAIFAEQAPAEHAAAALRADGFAATVERDDEGEFELTALRSDPVAPPVVHELTWRVKETVERHGGTYDGWNCQVATAA
jgi:hypothetical protein